MPVLRSLRATRSRGTVHSVTTRALTTSASSLWLSVLLCGCARLATESVAPPADDIDAHDATPDLPPRMDSVLDANVVEPDALVDAAHDRSIDVPLRGDVVILADIRADLSDSTDGDVHRPDALPPSPHGPCSTPDYPDEGWDQGICACLGASAGATGICRNPFALGVCRQGLCLDGNNASIEGLYCLSLDRAREFDAECESRAFCSALRALDARPPRTAHTSECRYSDGTAFETGDVPAASCPAGSATLLCGRGCATCTRGAAICWGFSEQDPLGACVSVSDTSRPCTSSSDCSPGASCLRPRNLDSLNRSTRGICQPAEHCQRVAMASVGRFSCDR
jgi:hypothetical protein